MGTKSNAQKVLRTLQEVAERQRDQQFAERAKRISDARIQLGQMFWEAMEKKDFETLGRLLESSPPSLRDRIYC